MFRKKSQFKTSKIAKKRRKKLVVRVISYSLLVVAFVFGLSFLSRAQFLNIKEIKVIGNNAIKTEEIIKIAEEKISGKVAGLFSRSNVLLYPRYEIESEILKQFKRISDAEVSIEKFSILNIEITERQIFGLWCEALLNQISDEKCFYLDKTGFLFDEAPNFSGNSYVRYYTATSSEAVSDYFVETSDFERLNTFLTQLSKTFNVQVLKVVNNPESIEIYFNVGTKIILSSDSDFEKTLENLVVFVNELKSQKEVDSFASFEHIDLQFGNKIFYKLR